MHWPEPAAPCYPIITRDLACTRPSQYKVQGHHLSDQLRHSQELRIFLAFSSEVIKIVGVGLEQELLELCNLQRPPAFSADPYQQRMQIFIKVLLFKRLLYRVQQHERW